MILSNREASSARYTSGAEYERTKSLCTITSGSLLLVRSDQAGSMFRRKISIVSPMNKKIIRRNSVQYFIKYSDKDNIISGA